LISEIMKRRQFFKGGVVTGALLGITGVSAEELPKTPKEVEGLLDHSLGGLRRDFF